MAHSRFTAEIGQGTSRRAGAPAITLIEMMAALVILALAITVSRLTLDGITVRWRLRGAAHEVESVAQWALNAAASRSRPTRVLYDIQENSWWVQMGDETFAYHRLPQGVAFVSVRFPDGTEVVRDVAEVTASPDGTLDPHVVTLTGHSGEEVVLSFDRLTGEMTYEEKTGDAE
jgi:type II secretory pathway pseudopilin PulG